MEVLPITAFIVSKNEGHLLEACLKSIGFCNEIIVVNLQSTDNTEEIARKYGAKILTVPPLPVVEMVHEKYIHRATNDWVLVTDPDEVASDALVANLKADFASITGNPQIGEIVVPIVYFFKSHQLSGTSWGGIKSRTYLVHKEKFVFTANVHNGRFLKEGYTAHTIGHSGKNHINHYWMQGYRQLLSKHLRYLKSEGKSRFDSGKRTNLVKVLKTPYQQFRASYVYKKGYRDGFVGLYLSFFRAWYFTAADLALYRYQKTQAKEHMNTINQKKHQ